MQALLNEADDYIEFIIKKNEGTLPKTINLKGYSRGADACIRLANRIYEKHPQIKINMFLVDPVPGPFHRDDDGSYIIPGNVERLDVTFMKDEKNRFFKPQHMGRLVIQNPSTTKVNEHYLEGVHGEAMYINQGVPSEEQKSQSHIETQNNLIQFIFDTTQKTISLPKCFRDGTKPADEQFTYINPSPGIPRLPIEENKDITDLTQITEDDRNRDEDDIDEKTDAPLSKQQEDNALTSPIQPQNKSNKNQKSIFSIFKALLHQQRTIAQEKHHERSQKRKLTQDHELMFYEKQFRDALNFYHYHYPYSENRRTTFEILNDALIRVKDILFGKTMDEKTKIWPDHHAALLIKEALEYEPNPDLSNNNEFNQILNSFISKLNKNLSDEDEELSKISAEKNPFKKYEMAKMKYDQLKGRKKENPIENNIFPNAVGNLSNESKQIIDDDIAEIERIILELKETLRLEKFKKTNGVIQKLSNSKFFKGNIQTYEHYLENFIKEVNSDLPEGGKISLETTAQNSEKLKFLETQYQSAQTKLKKLIDQKPDNDQLHKLYAIGQPQYIKPFMLSERKKKHQREKKLVDKIQINLSRRL